MRAPLSRFRIMEPPLRRDELRTAAPVREARETGYAWDAVPLGRRCTVPGSQLLSVWAGGWAGAV